MQICQTSPREKADPEFKVILVSSRLRPCLKELRGEAESSGPQSLVAQALIPAFKAEKGPELQRGRVRSLLSDVSWLRP